MSHADSTSNHLSPTDRWPELDPNRLPRHIAIIMDGNGRWAKLRGLPRLKGHHEGAASVKEVVRACRRLGIEALTLYAFSTENWGRPKTEVTGLMELLKRFLKGEEKEMQERGIRLATIGQTDRLPAGVARLLKKVMASTAAGREMVLTLALSYGGRDEIATAARKLAAECLAGKIKPEDIDEAAFSARLMTAELPEVDLLIRTSGELRLSNFLLWQSAYAEFVFTPTLWPDFREKELVEAVIQFQGRQRRFGMTGDNDHAGGA